MHALKQLDERLTPAKLFALRTLAPLLLLGLRLKVASVFLMDGWLKLGYVLHGEPGSLYALFEETYKVPLLPVKLAAWLCVTGELGFGLLLALGLFARLGAFGIIIISAVIYNSDENPMAAYWALACATIVVFGAGKWSLDTLIFKGTANRESL